MSSSAASIESTKQSKDTPKPTNAKAHYGATPEEWSWFADEFLGLGIQADLLPVVSNPRAVIAPNSKIKPESKGKVPSIYNENRHVIGVVGWPTKQATADDIREWIGEQDYGIGINGRTVRSLDVDVTIPWLAQEVCATIAEHLGLMLPKRGRSDKSKFLLAFTMPGTFNKRVLTFRQHKAQKIEFLANGQMFVAAGTHQDGARYEWTPRYPQLVPIEPEQFESLCLVLAAKYGDWSDSKGSYRSREGKLTDAIASDPVVIFLREKGLVISDNGEGKFIITCPFADLHTTGSDEAAYFARFTNGYEKGHFLCFHGHGKTHADANYLDAIGFGDEREEDLEGANPAIAAQIRASKEDVMFLPNDHFEGPPAARRIFKYMGNRRELYRRGVVVVEVDNNNQVSVVKAVMLRSRLNTNSKKTRAFVMLPDNGALVHKAKACSESTAAMLLACLETKYLMPIAIVSRSPVLAESAGILKSASPGYNDFGGGILVTSDVAADTVSLTDAVAALRELVKDFHFASDGDESRALVSIVSPCLRMGRLVQGDALMVAMEADHSQTGKGYFLKIVRQIYGEKPYTVNLKDGGVGGFDESLSEGLLSGRPFIAFDNLRGRLRSQLLESVLTAGEDPVSARVPYRGDVQVDIQSISFQLTSNGVDSTVDLANRLLVIRLRKQKRGYSFASFSEGDLLEHIDANRGFYLGCVHAVVRAWYDAGKVELPTEHSFRHWVGALDWIAQNVFQRTPILEGHAVVIERISKPELTWLRQIGIAIIKAGKAGQEHRAGDLFGLSEDLDIPLPGAHRDAEQGAQNVGRILARCFPVGSDVVEVEDIRVRRSVIPVWDDTHRKEREQKSYVFESVDGL